jgi:organic hydroperoxide reductase OsmC/OhrA
MSDGLITVESRFPVSETIDRLTAAGVASADMIETATGLHEEAHARCFIASSVNFSVRHEPVTAMTR